jgi:hypothetical protein
VKTGALNEAQIDELVSGCRVKRWCARDWPIFNPAFAPFPHAWFASRDPG